MKPRRCGARCPEEPGWICARTAGHPGRHESPDGGDWFDGPAQRDLLGTELDEVLEEHEHTGDVRTGSVLCDAVTGRPARVLGGGS